jgi:NADP-dependent 3-hydroxy acid dehydrogenase YdfG
VRERFKGKVALVTGASSGIGAATAAALAREGVAVAAAARRADRLEALRDTLAAEGAVLLPVPLDVASEESCEEAVERTTQEFGVPDILINNAGVMMLGPVLSADTADWRRMVETNVLGLMYLSRAALRLMAGRGAGDIVQISSVAARRAEAGTAVYTATKWAVNGFSEALRQEALKHGVRVMVIEPGIATTEIADHITHDRVREQVKEHYGSFEVLSPEDVASAILYSLERPSHVTVNELLIRPTLQRE